MKSARLKKIYTLLPCILAVGLTACGSDSGSDSGSESSAAAKPAAPSPELSIEDIKSYTFSWTAVADTTHYKLLENADAMSGFSQVGDNINANATRYEHIVPLYNRLNAEYILQACNSAGCTNSSTLAVSPTISQLNAAIGYIKASNTGDNYAEFGGAVSISDDGLTLAIGATGDKSNATGINGDQTDSSFTYAGAVYVFTRSGATWTQQAYIKASDTEINDRFGISVSLNSDGSTLAVGASEDSQPTNNGEGNVYIYSRSGSTWTEDDILEADSPIIDELFGQAISLSDDGKTLAIGSNKDNAYIFTLESTGWAQKTKLSGRDSGDGFGYDLSLSGDGKTLAVGSTGEDGDGSNDETNNGSTSSGAAFVFSADASGTWTQQGFLKASNVTNYDNFGNAVSLSQDGSTLAVASKAEDGQTISDNALSDSGAVYIFTRSGSTWSQQSYLKASNSEESDSFGTTLSLSGDGTTLAVHSKNEASEATGISTDGTGEDDNEQGGAGAVYIYTSSGSTWSQTAYLKATNTENGSAFGNALSLSGDGTTLVAGFSQEESNATGIGGDQTDDSVLSAGAVYLY